MQHRLVAQKPIDWFMEHCISAVEEERVASVIKKMSQGVGNGLTKAGHVEGFAGGSPSKLGDERETLALRKYDQFVQKIVINDPWKRPCPYPTFQHSLIQELPPDKAGCSDAAYGHLEDTTKEPRTWFCWVDCLYAAVLNPLRTYSNVIMNRKQIVHLGTAMMHDNDRRNFSIGLTVEDDFAQIWHFSRSGIIASKSFKWIESPIYIIKLILSLCHYPQIPEEHDIALQKMGFDYTLRAVRKPAIDEAEDSQEIRVNVVDEDSFMRSCDPGPLANEDDVQDIPSCHGDCKTDSNEYPMYEFTMQIPNSSCPSQDPTPVRFRTLELLFKQEHHMKLVHHATRVWLVCRADDPACDERWVMKESWVEEGFVTEGDVWRNLREAVKKRAQDADAPLELEKLFENHFVQLLADEVLEVHPDVPKACLQPNDIRGIENGDIRKIINIVEDDNSESDVLNIFRSVPTIPTETVEKKRALAQQWSEDFIYWDLFPWCRSEKLSLSIPRRKYRTLYAGGNHVQPIDKLSDIKNIHKALVGTCDGLEVLYQVGMIHGDVSSGNIYYDTKSNTGRLGDLEHARLYAKPQSFPQCPGGDLHFGTGTPHFQSAEVAYGCYMIDSSPVTVERRAQEPKWCQNFLHDAESVYWLLKYIPCAFQPKWSEGSARQDIEASMRGKLFDISLPHGASARLDDLSCPRWPPAMRASMRIDRNLTFELTDWTIKVLDESRKVGEWLKGKYSAIYEASLQPQVKGSPDRCGYDLSLFSHIFPELKAKLEALEPIICNDQILAVEMTEQAKIPPYRIGYVPKGTKGENRGC